MANIDDGFRVEILSIDDETLVATGNFDPSQTGYEAPVGSLFLSQLGDAFIKFDVNDNDWKTIQSNEELNQLLNDINEPTGFVTRETSTLQFNDITRTFTIEPRTPTYSSYEYYIKGQKYTVTAPNSIQLPDITETYFIYFDANQNLQFHTGNFAPWLVIDVVLASIVYWNATDQQASYVADERHGISMDGDTHSHFHISFGTLYINGLGVTNINTAGNGDQDSHAQCSIENGIIRDEDLSINIVNTGESTLVYDLEQQLSPLAQIPVLWRNGSAAEWSISTPTNFPFLYSGDGNGFIGPNNRPPFNEWTGVTWQLTEVENNRYFFTHILATNDIRNPIVALQGIQQYQNKPQSQTEAKSELATFAGLPFAEFYPIATLICESRDAYANTPKVRFVPTNEGQDYIDWRDNESSSLGIINFTADHGNLSGLGDDDHTQYALAGPGSTRTFNLGDLIDTNLTGSPADGDVLTWNATTSEWVNSPPPGSGGGEANTGNNIGTGIGVFANKGGTTLNFYSLKSEDSTISIILDGTNNEIDFSINDNTIDHANLLNIGTNTHTQIDAHIADNNNPHNTSIELLTDVSITGSPTVIDGYILNYVDGVGWVSVPNQAQEEVDNIETASGNIFAADGTFDNVAVNGALTTVTGATNLLEVLVQMETELAVDTPSNVLFRHNGNITQTFDVTPIPIVFDTVVEENDNFTYLGNGSIQINNSGRYLVYYDITYTATGNSRTTSETYVTLDGITVDGSHSYGYHRTVDEGLQTITSVVMLDITGSPGTPVTLEVLGHKYAGGSLLTSIANACRLNILTLTT